MSQVAKKGVCSVSMPSSHSAPGSPRSLPFWVSELGVKPLTWSQWKTFTETGL